MKEQHLTMFNWLCSHGLNSLYHVMCEVAKVTPCLLVNVLIWKSKGWCSILNFVRKYLCIHEEIICIKMLFWCTSSKNQRSKMWSTDISYLVCSLIWNIHTSRGNVLSCTVLSPLCSISLPFISMHNMSAEMLYVQWMHHNLTAHIHIDAFHRSGCCPLCTIWFFFGLWLHTTLQRHWSFTRS